METFKVDTVSEGDVIVFPAFWIHQAPINEKSTIVYKLVKPYTQPTVAQIEDPPPNPQEQALYQMKKQNKKLNDIVSLLLELFDKKIKSVKDKDD